eukprot:9146131-Alexandrium_andersonii.AAC.1
MFTMCGLLFSRCTIAKHCMYLAAAVAPSPIVAHICVGVVAPAPIQDRTYFKLLHVVLPARPERGQ